LSITRKVAMSSPPIRWSIPEPLTHLYYSPVYTSLTVPQRLAYNRLHLCYMCELYVLFEENFPRFYEQAALSEDVSRDERAQVAALASAEAHHARWFGALAEHLAPHLYREAGGPHFIRVPAWLGRLMRWAFLRPRWFPALFWIVMLMEERAVYYADQVAADAESLDPETVRVHEWHKRDEAAHLNIDEALLRRYWDRNAPWVRRVNGWLMRYVFAELLTTPKRGGVRLVRQWIRECPELAPRQREFEEAMRALGENPRFQASIFSRAIVPRSLEQLDRWPELRSLRRVLVAETAG
jgi:hypothetical protein